MVHTKNTINNTKISLKKLNGVISDKVGNYQADPFFVKKAAEAKALIKKVGLPKMEKNN